MLILCFFLCSLRSNLTFAQNTLLRDYTIVNGVNHGSFPWWSNQFSSSDYTVSTNNPLGRGQLDYTGNPQWRGGNVSFSDHTGDGQAMIVGRGSTNADRRIIHLTFYVSIGDVVDLSAYVRAGHSNNRPVLGWEANGVLVGSTVNPTTSQWSLMSTTFTAGTSGYVTFSIENSNLANSGNYFAIDDIVIQHSVQNTCTKPTFYDTGGATGNYSNNQDYTVTHCGDYGKLLRANFSSFNVASGDLLRVYDGSSTSAPLMGSYSGVLSGTITSSENNCLTFRFTSNGSGVSSGWVANFSCIDDPECVDLTGVFFNHWSSGNYNPGTATAVNITNGPVTVYTNQLNALRNFTASVSSTANDGSAISTRQELTGAATVTTNENVAAYTLPSGDVGATWGAGTYTLKTTLYESNGQSGKVCGYNETTLIIEDCNLSTFNPPSTQTACIGSSFNLSSGTAISGATYSWSGPNAMSGFTGTNTASPSHPSLTSAAAGVYTVTVTSSGCSATATTTLALIQSPQVSITKNNATCGLNDGSLVFSISNDPAQTNIQISINGGSTFPYSTNDNVGTYTIPNLGPGNYTPVIRWSSGTQCPVTFATQSIIRETGTVNITGTSTICSGSSTTLTGNLVNGVNPVTYNWNSGAGNAANFTVSPTSTTSYSLVATDLNGCTASANITVTVNALPTSSPSVNSPLCQGGTINLSGNSGMSEYLWTTPTGATYTTRNANIPSATLASQGFYKLRVRNANGCYKTDSTYLTIFIDQEAEIENLHGGDYCENETITLRGRGANTYSWQGPGGYTLNNEYLTRNNATLSMAGLYTLRATDSNGCWSTDTMTVNVISTAINLTNDGPKCVGSTINFTASGGSGTYTWSGPNVAGFVGSTPSRVNAQTSDEGTYQITSVLTPTCTVVATSQLTLYALPNVSVVDTVTVCTNDDATLSASGGVSYHWTGPAGFNQTVTSGTVTVYNVNNSKSGWYTVDVQNASGCHALAQTFVDINYPALAFSTNSPVCQGQTIFFTASGASYYSWSGPGFSSSVQNPTKVNAQLINEGEYTLTAANSLGCTADIKFNVNILESNPMITGTAVVCSGDSIKLDMSEWPSYSWTGPNGFTSTDRNIRIGNATSAMSGVYSVTLTNSTSPGCTATATFNVTVRNWPNVQIAGDTIVCRGDNMQLTASGAVNYTWSGPLAFTAASATAIRNNMNIIHGGYYKVHGIDAFGCENDDSVLVVISYPNINIGGEGIVCFGSNFNLTSNTGFSYNWVGPNSYVSTQEDPTISNANLSHTGYYTLTATNSDLCSAKDSVYVIVSRPPVNISSSADACIGSDYLLQGQGGISFMWTGPNSFSSNSQSITIPNFQTVNQGNYILTVLDTAGCSLKDTLMVNARPLPIPSGLGNTGPICVGEQVNFTAAGGNTYQWVGPAGSNFTSLLQNPSISAVNANHAGVYTVTVISTYGCSSTASTSLQVNALPIPTLSSSVNNTCVGEQFTLTAGGGQTYTFIGPDITRPENASNTWVRSNVSADQSGTYFVTVKNAAGCEASANTIVNIYALPVVPTTLDTVKRCGNGTVTITASGCAGTYTWYNAANAGTSLGTGASFTTPVLTTGASGTTYNYYVDCTIFSCPSSSRKNVKVIVNVNPTITSVSSTGVHCVYTSAQLFVTATNTVSYAWVGPAGSGFSSNVEDPIFETNLNSGGVYTVTATRDNGCTATSTINLTMDYDCRDICQAWVRPDPVNPTSCTNNNGQILGSTFTNGAYEFSVNGTTWINTGYSTTGVASGLSVGSYLVYIRDAASDKICQTAYVTLRSTTNDITTSVTNASGCFDKNGSIQISGLNPSDEVSWLGFVDRDYVSASTLSGGIIPNLEPGNYYLRVKNSSSVYCYKENIVTVGNTGVPCNTGAICDLENAENKFVGGDFGSGTPQQAAPLDESLTDYGYVELGPNSPNDGFYTIINRLDVNGATAGSGVFGSTWVVLNSDHTPNDTNGYMMVVNSSIFPDAVVEQQIDDLCPNSRYNFTAWIYNICPTCPSVQPNLAFLIDGVAKYTTGTITNAGWIQVGFSFETGNNSSSVFAIRNNNLGGDGNDWVIDDIVVAKCPLDIALAGTTVACLGGTSETIDAKIYDPLAEYTYYKWQQRLNPSDPWTDVSAVIQGTYNSQDTMTVNFSLPTPVPSSISGVEYQIVLATTATGFNNPNCVVSSGLTSIIVPPINMNLTEDTAKCIGTGSLTLQAIPSGGTAPYSYTWNQGLANASSHVVNPDTTTTYIVTARDADNCPVTDTVTIEVKTQPTLTVTVDEDSICTGGDATIRAIVLGGSGSFTYQWFESTSETGPWTAIPGATADSLKPITTSAIQRYYRVFVADLIFDCNDATSNAVLFTVFDDPTITMSLSDTTFCLGGNVTLIPTINGGQIDLSYQWQVSDNGSTGWSDVSPNGTSESLSIPSASQGIKFYRLQLTSTGNGCVALPSAASRVEVLPTFNVNTLIDNAEVCLNGPATLTADTSAATGNITFQWFVSDDNVSFTTTGGNTLSLSPNTGNIGIKYYRVEVTASGAGCGTAISDTTTVRVLPAFDVQVLLDGSDVCSGGNVVMTADTINGMGAVTYQWQRWNGASWVNIFGQTGLTYTATNFIPNDYFYRVVANSAGIGCGEATSDSVRITVLPTFSVELALDNDSVCAGGLSQLSPLISNGTGQLSYQWYEYTPGIGLQIQSGATDSIFTANTTSAGIRYYMLELTADGRGCGTIISDTLAVQILPNFTVDISPDDAIVCLGGPVLITADTTGGFGSVNYEWYESDNGTNFTLISGATSDTYAPTTTNSGTRYYTLTATSAGIGCGMDDADTVSVEVLPLFGVEVLMSDTTLCIGGALTLTADTLNVVGNINYQWQQWNGVSFQNIPGETGLSYSPSTANEGTRFFKVLASSDGPGCGSALSDSVMVTVLPEFSAAIVLDNHQVCIGGIDSLIATKQYGTGTISYQWYEYVPGNPLQLITGATDSVFYPNTNNLGIRYYVAEVIASGTGCGSVFSDTASMEVLPNFDVSVSPNSQLVCVTGEITITSQTVSAIGNITYQWFVSSDNINFTPISGETDSFLVVSGVLPGTNYYSVEASATGAGCGVDTAAASTIELLPQLSVDLLPNDTSICRNEPLTLVGTPQNGVGDINYQWQILQGSNWVNIIGATDSVFVMDTDTAGNFNYRLWAFADGEGCTDTATAIVNVLIFDYPDVTVNSINTLCVDDNGVIVFSFADEPNKTQIQFSIDGGLSYPFVMNDNLGSYQIDTLQAGNYQLAARWDGLACPINLGAVIITDRPAPVVTVSSTDPICDVNNGSITFSFNDDTTRTQLEFSLDGGITYLSPVNDNIGSVTYDNLAPLTFDLWVRWENDDCPVSLGAITLTNHTSPIIAVSNDTIICFGQTVLLQASNTLGDAPFTFSWNNGLPDGTSHLVSPAVDTKYYVTVTDANNCTSIDSINVIVNPLPTATLTGGTYCEGITIELTASNGFTYQWSGPAGFSSTLQNPTILNSSTLNAGQYYLSYTDINNCQNVDSVLVVVNEAPDEPTLTDAFRCGPGEITFNASGCTGGTITWYPGQFDLTVAGYGTTFVTDSLVASKYYYANCTDPLGCVSFEKEETFAEIREISNADVIPVNSTCLGIVPLNNGMILITGFRDGERWSFSPGESFDPSNATPATPEIIPLDGWVYRDIDNPTGAIQRYTVQIISQEGCPTEHVIEYQRQCDTCFQYCEPAEINLLK